MKRTYVLSLISVLIALLCRAQTDVSVEFRNIPRWDTGGPDKLGQISGVVHGSCLECRIVLFTKAGGEWWVQPLADAPFTKLDDKNGFASNIHLGSEYAAILVSGRPYSPPARTATLPEITGDVLFVARATGTAPEISRTNPSSEVNSWKLVWSDEFDGPANSQPDETKWSYDLGNNQGWGNDELQTYTNSTTNVHLDGIGHLVIRVTLENGEYTSARIKTEQKFATQYGKIEARIKLPHGKGLWPAFWMLGTNIESAKWPICGEIDVMEHSGREPFVNHGSLHGPGYSGENSVTGTYTLSAERTFADDFHIFAVAWSPEQISFFVDDSIYFAAGPASIPSASKWVFDKPFFLILNMAVGGRFPGSPDSTTVFPQELIVDYVRVYRQTIGSDK